MKRRKATIRKKKNNKKQNHSSSPLPANPSYQFVKNENQNGNKGKGKEEAEEELTAEEEFLIGCFLNFDTETIKDILASKEGNLELATRCILEIMNDSDEMFEQLPEEENFDELIETASSVEELMDLPKEILEEEDFQKLLTLSTLFSDRNLIEIASILEDFQGDLEKAIKFFSSPPVTEEKLKEMIDTLNQMFPSIKKEIIRTRLIAFHSDFDLTVEALSKHSAGLSS